MEEFVPFDPKKHMKEYRKLSIETASWHYDQIWENYQLDASEILGQTPEEYVDDHLEELSGLKPPDGLIYLLMFDGKVVGMGAIHKLSDEIGEIRRMWNRPEYRGKGYGKMMVKKLLEAGKEFGCSVIRLSTPKFAHAAHHIYRSAGFRDRALYNETEVPSKFRSYWLYMERPY